MREAVARSVLHARALVGGRDYQRFVIVGVARTGSTLLLDLLNAHGQVVALGELFRGDGAIGWDRWPFRTLQSPKLLRLHEARPVEFLETAVFRRWPREVAAVGFKLFYYHARAGAQATVWDYLANDPDLAVIHLQRMNLLEQYLSLRLAHATNVWSSLKSAAPAEPIRLSADDCVRHFQAVQAQEAACDAHFAGHRILTVTYEDLVADRPAAMARVAAHLGLRPGPLEAKVVRQRTQPLSRAIANYEELRDVFAGSTWERFFRAPDTAAGEQEAA
ncbi:sulfotransferase [Phenylobacterium sp. LjRoot219]|uniref:Stf0 family sulfotransferase n=1 Tax=Phenylobacterium sp. LjRoot219 TaxID=3342283 RepID=UPI003ECF3D70